MTLESLRKRAKTLLHQVHAREPDAVERLYRWHPRWKRFYKQKLADVFRLADAQLIVARELGHPSWPRLKAALEGGARVAEPVQAENPYVEFVDRVARSPIMEVVRCANVLSPLPGRRPLENRGAPLPEAKLEALLGGLVHDSPKVRRFCLELLDSHPDDRTLPHILRCLDDPVPRVRWHAVHALGCDTCKDGTSFLGAEVRRRLAELAEHDPSQKVRSQARLHLAQVPAVAQRLLPAGRGAR